MKNSEAPYSIRKVDKADDTILAEMLYHAIYVSPGQVPPDREIIQQPELAKYVRQWGRQGDEGLLLVDESSQHVVGAVWSRLFSEKQKSFGYVDVETPELSIALLPEYRRQGLGTTLLTSFLTHLQREGYRAVSLSVSDGNPAKRLYRRLGFYETGGRYEESLTMLKDLS